MKLILAIAPVLFAYLLDVAKEWWSDRNINTAKKRMRKMHEAVKSRDIDRVNKLFNSTKKRR